MQLVLILSYVLCYVLYIFSTLLPNLKILQLEEYKMLNLIKFNIKNRLIIYLPILINLLYVLIYGLGFKFNILLYISICIIFVIYIFLLLKFNKSIKGVIYTRRIKRIILLNIVLSTMLLLLSITYKIMLYLLCILTITNEIVTITSNLFIKIFECILLKYYVKNASNKLRKSKIIKIAITGSYGKTSVKNILNTILCEKYSVLMTPESYNTPSGISITINNSNLQKYEVLIMEMGAKKKGDISYLCNKFKPDIGVITSIGEQHLSSFKNIENIILTKSEILTYVDTAIFNCDNKYVKEMFDNFNGKKITVGINGNICAKNIKLTSECSKFDIYYMGDFFSSVSTMLTGEHNIQNILLAVAVAMELDLDAIQISQGINNLRPVKSRMEKNILSNGATVINNGYNSNPSSVLSSFKLLDLYENKRKVIITPGFIEMGKEQYSHNYTLGKLIADKMDYCIVVNVVNRNAIIKGMVDNGFNNFKAVDRFKDIDFSCFNSDDVVLIENDLPDNYV